MADLVISENFTIEDIHKIREYNYENRKSMSFEEKKIDISKGSNEFLQSLEKLRKERLKKNMNQLCFAKFHN